MNYSLPFLQKPFKMDIDKANFHPSDNFNFLNSIKHNQICVMKFFYVWILIRR